MRLGFCLVPWLAVAAPSSAAGEDPGGREEAIRLSRELLGRELGNDAREFMVREATPAEWADTSLGCPEKGSVYQPVVTAGWRVILAVGDREHTVHVAGERAVRCPPGASDREPPRAGETARSPVVLDLVQRAREDLAARFGEAAGRARLTGVHRTTWPDASLGCPRPGRVYAQVRTDGYRLELELDGRPYTYHSDERRVVACPGPGKD